MLVMLMLLLLLVMVVMVRGGERGICVGGVRLLFLTILAE